mmetsp:Transcript_23016/g.67892  ORF Transcript_23016/g.67892 Transcript_23016/m.67892 type:complete len:100 (+) Transcript_23016:131-430(+)
MMESMGPRAMKVKMKVHQSSGRLAAGWGSARDVECWDRGVRTKGGYRVVRRDNVPSPDGLDLKNLLSPESYDASRVDRLNLTDVDVTLPVALVLLDPIR